eukprot:TRINITY_DN5608_c2_g1_i1.p1 TRINITY_DN5608_c2_g1~~TRINITY_DN5608_c2_g1_i1.p1  ORF type:complete len:1185 (+),score=262.03 TRINITY_DN5608_c2_g1_i1:3-3557(+)
MGCCSSKPAASESRELEDHTHKRGMHVEIGDAPSNPQAHDTQEDKDDISQMIHKKLHDAKETHKLDLSKANLKQLPPKVLRDTHLEKLYLSNNSIAHLPSLARLSKLQVLQVIGNHLGAVPDDLGVLTNLLELNLSLNRVVALPELGGLIKLRELCLSSNRLTSVPASIFQLPALMSLNLAYNYIVALPPNIDLPLLEELLLAGNNLVTLPPSISTLKSLKDLDVHFNRLTSLPDTLPSLKSLRTINLTRNCLEQLPPHFGDLPSLSEAMLGSNYLKSLPPTFTNLHTLKRLVLSKNKLTALPESLSALTALNLLFADDNQLTELPQALSRMTQLNIIHLATNPIHPASLPLEVLPGCSTINLARCWLSVLPPLSLNPQRITKLDLTSNNLVSLPDLGGLVRLLELHVPDNMLASLPESITQLTSLTVLNLFGNTLTSIPIGVSALQNLKKLLLSYNCLVSLPDSLSCLSNLQELSLSSNRLIAPAADSLASLSFLAALTELRTLSLAAIGLTQIPTSLLQLAELQSLDLSRNKISSLPPALFSDLSLTALDLTANSLTDLPPFVLSNKKLRSVLVSANPLSPGSAAADSPMCRRELANESYIRLVEEDSRVTQDGLGLQLAAVAWIGKRSSMEDVCSIQPNLLHLDGNHLFSVFDGHSGLLAARICADNIRKYVEYELKLLSEPHHVFSKSNPSLLQSADDLRSFTANFQLPLDLLQPFTQGKSKSPSPSPQAVATSAAQNLPAAAAGTGSDSAPASGTFVSGSARRKSAKRAEKETTMAAMLGAVIMLQMTPATLGIEAQRPQQARSPASFERPVTALDSRVRSGSGPTPKVGDAPSPIARPIPPGTLARSTTAAAMEDVASPPRPMLSKRAASDLQGVASTPAHKKRRKHELITAESDDDDAESVSSSLSRPTPFVSPASGGIPSAAGVGDAGPPTVVVQNADTNPLVDIDPLQVLSNAFSNLHELLSFTEGIKDIGTTATVFYFRFKQLNIANVGDSRGVMFRNGTPLRLTFDHKPDVLEEEERIKSRGGFVSEDGRVCQMLAVSRALGDFHLNPFVSPFPHVRTVEIDEGDDFFVLASDGLWDTVSEEQAYELIRRQPSAIAAALVLRDYAAMLGSTDNITIIVGSFHNNFPHASYPGAHPLADKTQTPAVRRSRKAMRGPNRSSSNLARAAKSAESPL